MAEPLDGPNDQICNVLVFPCPFVRDAVGEDDLRGRAADDETLDNLTVAQRLLKLGAAGCVVVVIELRPELDVTVGHLRNGFSVGHHAHALFELVKLPMGRCGAGAVCRLRTWVISLRRNRLTPRLRHKEVVQTYDKYVGLFCRWTMLVFKTSSFDAELAPVPKRDVAVASVLLHGLC